MSEVSGGADWERASDGKWYAPGVLSRAGWWCASDGVWYPPQQAAPQPPANDAVTQVAPRKKGLGAGGVIAIVAGSVVALLVLVGIIGAIAGGDGDQSDDASAGGTSASVDDVEDAEALAAELDESGAVDCADVAPLDLVAGRSTSARECVAGGVHLFVFDSTADRERYTGQLEAAGDPCGAGDDPLLVAVVDDNWYVENRALGDREARMQTIADAMGAEVLLVC